MFEASLVESTPFLQKRSRWPALLSFAIQAAIVVTLVLIPMLHPEVIPLATPKIHLEAPRFIPQPIPPPIQPIRVRAATASTEPSAPAQSAQPRPSFRSDAQAVDAPALAVGIDLRETGPNPLTSLATIGPTHTTVIGITSAPATKGPASPMRISTGVISGLLIAPIRPDYPPIARTTRTEGTVVVQAIISTTGLIESAHVVSGPPMLQASALQAVRAARYRPFLLNGAPTEVETTISINFRLGPQ